MNAPDTNQHTLRAQRIGFAFALASAGLFSLKAVAVKLALAKGASVEVLMLWRMSFALPVYLVVGFYSFKRARKDQTSPRTLAAAAVLGVLSYYVCTWLDFSGMWFISAQLERMILFTYPILTALLTRVILGEKFTLQHGIALVLSYIGVLIVFGSEMQSIGNKAFWGIGLVFAAALLFSFYVIYAKPVIQRLGSKLFTSVAMVAATAAIVIHNLATIAATNQAWSDLFTFTALSTGVFLALFCTVLPSFMLSEAIARIGAMRASAAGNIGPVVTTVLAVLILDEPFGIPQAVGLILITIGVGLVGRLKNKQPTNDR